MTGAPTILVVDDDRNVRDMVVEYLAGQGYAIAVAADATEMRSVLAERRVDLVLLDRTMPDGDGVRLVPELRQGHNLPVILVTALSAEDERVRGLDGGADDYVTKPFNWRELMARINAVLRRAVVARAAVQAGTGRGEGAPNAVGRRQAAVVCADVAGYVRLMQDNEEETVRDWWHCRQTVIDPSVAAWGGRIVKFTGDGFFAEFPAVPEAFRCALAIQDGAARCNADRPETRQMWFRIALNWCTIVADAEDIYGDGVNLAARLQTLAEAGGICVSETVRDALGPVDGVAFEALGPRMLKHIAEPVQAYRVIRSG